MFELLGRTVEVSQSAPSLSMLGFIPEWILSLSVVEAGRLLMNNIRPVTDISYCHRLHKVTFISNSRDTRSRNFYQKLVPIRSQLCSVQATCTRHFQTQPTDQTARFSVQVSGTVVLVVQWFGIRLVTRHRKVAGSTPGRGTIKSTRSMQPSIPPG